MLQSRPLLAATVLLVGALSCDSEHVEPPPTWGERMVVAYEDYNSVLAKIEDVPSAEAHHDQLLAAVDQIVLLTKETLASTDPMKPVIGEAYAELADRLPALSRESAGHMQRLARTPEVMLAMADVWTTWGQLNE